MNRKHTIVACLLPGPYLSVGGFKTRAVKPSGLAFGSTCIPNSCDQEYELVALLTGQHESSYPNILRLSIGQYL